MSKVEIEAKIAALREEVGSVKGIECGVFQRITGYYRATRNWNKGKKEEYLARKEYALPVLGA